MKGGDRSFFEDRSIYHFWKEEEWKIYERIERSETGLDLKNR